MKKINLITQFPISSENYSSMGYIIIINNSQHAKYLNPITKVSRVHIGWTKEMLMKIVSNFRLEFIYD